MTETHSLKGLFVAIYARFSSERQREASIEDQQRVCAEYIVRHGGEIRPELMFADRGISAASMDRAALDAMMQLVQSKPRRVDAIVCEDIGRISRDLADAAEFFKLLAFLQVPLIGVSDGINTSQRDAKLTYTVKALMNDLYLDDLRAKTLRGLEGRAAQGHATGAVPFGFRTEPLLDGRGEIIGHVIKIHDEQARVVRRIFSEYLAGRSLSGIASLFNQGGLAPPRSHRRRAQGWAPTTVRWILHNEAYAGFWTFKKRQWVKLPGTNTRRPRARPAKEVMRREHQDLRVIDADTWEQVQGRLRAVRACYTQNADGSPKGRAIPGKATPYVLSGLLRCGICSAPMVVYGGGAGSRRYRCVDELKRGNCKNRLSVREELAKVKIIEAMRRRFSDPNLMDYAYKRAADQADVLEKTGDAELVERRKHLSSIETKIDRLIEFIANGQSSEYVQETLRKLEADAKAAKVAIATMGVQRGKPRTVRVAGELEERFQKIEELIEADPVAGREQLRRLLHDDGFKLVPQQEGYYVAKSDLLPLVLLTETPPRRSSGAAYTAVSCGGRI